jgi:hypothetical protein
LVFQASKTNTGKNACARRLLVSLQVFGGDIVLGDLPGVNFSYIRVRCIFHAGDRLGLEGLTLLYQFFDAL